MYGMSQAIADRNVVGDITRYFLDAMYYTPNSKSIDQEMKNN